MKIENHAGLWVDFLENGAVRRIQAGPVRISLRDTTLFSGPGCNIYIRRRSGHVSSGAMLGPESGSSFASGPDGFIAEGIWKGLQYSCSLQLSDKTTAWQWNISLLNTGAKPVNLDMVCMQDVGLRHPENGPVNEYYVSQYIERRILKDEIMGAVICCRQNMKESTGNPSLMMACRNGAAGGSTDGMQFYGKKYKETRIPEGLVPDEAGGEFAGESSILALFEKPFCLQPGEHHESSFLFRYFSDHPEATSESDLSILQELAVELNRATPGRIMSEKLIPQTNIFNTSSLFTADDLDENELSGFFGNHSRHPEFDNGKLLSFFCGDNDHVVLRRKELLTDRPHAHIMQAGRDFEPDESIVSTTAFAFGVFNSHLTQGNTNFNTLLSVCTSQFNQVYETGQRIFVELDGNRFLLGVPSAFEMGLQHCRWIYRHEQHCFQVRTWTSKDLPAVGMDFKVLSGPPVNLIITHNFDAANGWHVKPGQKPSEFIVVPDAGSVIASKFPNGDFRIILNSHDAGYITGSRELPETGPHLQSDHFFVIDASSVKDFSMTFVGEVCGSINVAGIENADQQWIANSNDAADEISTLMQGLDLKSDNRDVAALKEILPWYAVNAMTHYLTPYGLEQFSGAAWGTRDVTQGPFDLLMCTGKYHEAKQLLRIVFSNQNPDGGWAQWWMFDSYSAIRADNSHGDIYYWCIIALSSYLLATHDLDFLDEVLPFYNEKGPESAGQLPLYGHIDRLIGMITDSFVKGTALVPFDGGDWNDSLQPVDRNLAARMISSWTVEMNFQAFSLYHEVCKLIDPEMTEFLEEICDRIKSDFNKYLIRDGIVAGYGLREDDGNFRLLLHPSDQETRIHYSILPMNRGIISGIFTKEQAGHHQELIKRHLTGPDGARLMDRPLQYKGGIQTIFQRAESSTFFGREIGLMYVHEHIRYAESLAITGRADEFVKALRQADPVGYRDIVPCGDLRQSNCYYSSSDVIFKNRYEADKLYDQIKSGNITLKGGWRVYSSGPGIYISLIITRLIGLRRRYNQVILDPVLPYSLDGLSAGLNISGHSATLKYSVIKDSFGPKSIKINDKPVPFKNEENPYRQGGAVIEEKVFTSMLHESENIILIEL